MRTEDDVRRASAKHPQLCSHAFWMTFLWLLLFRRIWMSQFREWSPNQTGPAARRCACTWKRRKTGWEELQRVAGQLDVCVPGLCWFQCYCQQRCISIGSNKHTTLLACSIMKTLNICSRQISSTDQITNSQKNSSRKEFPEAYPLRDSAQSGTSVKLDWGAQGFSPHILNISRSGDSAAFVGTCSTAKVLSRGRGFLFRISPVATCILCFLSFHCAASSESGSIFSSAFP